MKTYADGTMHKESSGYLDPDLPVAPFPYDATETSFMSDETRSCYGIDPNLFDTNTWRGETSLKGYKTIDGQKVRKEAAVARARSLCSTCPVRSNCLDFILKHPQDEGIWAGLLPEERAEYGRAA